MAQNITLTADLKSILEAAEADQASLLITLCGFGAYVPAVSGAGILQDAGTPKEAKQSGSTPITVHLYGNDQITPAGTFYNIAVKAANGNIVQSGNYQFTGSGTTDLSTIQPNYPAGLPPAFKGYVPLPFSTTPVFDGAYGYAFDLTLTGNVASSTLQGFAPGQLIMFFIAQDATGGRTFAWPSNVVNPPLIDADPLSVTTAAFIMRNNGKAYPLLGWS